MAEKKPMIRIENLGKTFTTKNGQVQALDCINLEIFSGEIFGIIGLSGAGKSTLVRCINFLERPTRGTVYVDGTDLCTLSLAELGIARRNMGMIFQQFNLVNRLHVLTNVMLGALGRMPLWRSLLHFFPKDVRHLAHESLARVGIAEKAFQRASTLSGGQQQRAAIARALVQKAKVLLADEPIASLDPESSRRVMDILADVNKKDGITVLVSLHQVDYATRYCPRTVALKDGRIIYDGPSHALTPAFLRDLYGADGATMIAGIAAKPHAEARPSKIVPIPVLDALAAA